jgi:hypothetical protein
LIFCASCQPDARQRSPRQNLFAPRECHQTHLC